MINKEILKTITILYVEDEDDIREFTSKILQNLTAKIYCASNGQEGLETYLEHQDKIDLIITDINMPKMNGLDMCAAIRKENKKVPIVVTTAYSSEDFLKQSIEIGVNAYAMKPIDLYQLIESITKAVEPIYLQKELNSLNNHLEKNIEKETNKLKSILDSQDNIIVLTQNQNIVDVNKRFLTFFGLDSIDEYKDNCVNILSLVEQDYGYITIDKIKDKNWFEYISELPEIDRVVKIKSLTNNDRIFSVNLNTYSTNSDFFVLTLTDITEIKERTNLLEYQASHDRLTGLFNRVKFDEIYPKEFSRDKRYNNNLTAIMFDIDDFKKVNDTYGHAVGDDVLRELGSLIQKNIRECDIPVRWGGEEFLILLPQTDLLGAQTVASKIKTSIEKNIFSRKELNITSSFGISLLKKEDLKDEMIIRADEALYEAKQNGKNQIRIKED